MANGNTALAPDVATKVANEHRGTASDIGGQQKAFNVAVDEMDDVCKGDMMKALIEARDAWTSQLSKVIADLNEMAGSVDGTVGDISSQDSDNAGAVANISILKDI